MGRGVRGGCRSGRVFTSREGVIEALPQTVGHTCSRALRGVLAGGFCLVKDLLAGQDGGSSWGGWQRTRRGILASWMCVIGVAGGIGQGGRRGGLCGRFPLRLVARGNAWAHLLRGFPMRRMTVAWERPAESWRGRWAGANLRPNKARFPRVGSVGQGVGERDQRTRTRGRGWRDFPGFRCWFRRLGRADSWQERAPMSAISERTLAVGDGAISPESRAGFRAWEVPSGCRFHGGIRRGCGVRAMRDVNGASNSPRTRGVRVAEDARCKGRQLGASMPDSGRFWGRTRGVVSAI